MAKLSDLSLRCIIEGGETSTVELKVASPRPTEMAERLCGMANEQGGIIVIGVEDAEKKIVGGPNERGEVGREGLEPSRPFSQEILSLQCLPFHHRPSCDKLCAYDSIMSQPFRQSLFFPI